MNFEKIFDFLVFPAIRYLVRKIPRLKRRKFRCPGDALTKRELITHRVINSVDTVISEEAKERILDEMAQWGLIRKKWDALLDTPLTFTHDRFFTYSASILNEHVVPQLAALYEKENISYFVILPYPRTKKQKSRPTADFEQSLENRLGSRTIFREELIPNRIAETTRPAWLGQTRAGEKVLILQPMAMEDDYLDKAIAYVKKYSVSSIVEVLTIVDASKRPADKRSVDPPERVLIKLNLNMLQSKEERV